MSDEEHGSSSDDEASSASGWYGASDGSGSEFEDEDEDETAETLSNSVIDASDMQLDFRFTESLVGSLRAEVIGVANTFAKICREFGYDADNTADVLFFFLQDVLRAMQKHLATGFLRTRGKALTISTLFKFITCVFVAGTYNEAYSNLAADAQARGDKRNSFMRFDAELTLEDFNAIMTEIDGRTAGTRPGAEDPLLVEMRKGVTDSFARMLGYMCAETERVMLVLGVDDLQSKGSNAFAAGVTVKYNKAKATKLGIVSIVTALLVTRVPVAIVQETLDGKERGEKLGTLFANTIEKQLFAFAPGVPLTRVLADFDRGSSSMKHALARKGGLYVATIKKGGVRNPYNVFVSVSTAESDPPGYYDEERHVLVTEKGAAVSRFVRVNDRMTQVAQRIKNRLTFLETNVPELQGAVVSLLKRPARALMPPSDPSELANFQAVQALMSNVNMLCDEQRTVLWRIFRKHVITSTTVLKLARLDDQWRAHAELVGEDLTMVCGSFVRNERLANWKVGRNAEGFPSINSATATAAKAHLDFINELRLHRERALSRDLQAIAGDAIDDADGPALVRGGRALKIKGLPKITAAKELKPAQLATLRDSVRSAREETIPPDTFAAILEHGEASFKPTRAMKAGIQLEPVVRAAIPAFIAQHSNNAVAVSVFDAPGLYESKRSLYALTSPDGLFSLRRSGGACQVGVLEIKCLEDEDALAKVGALPNKFMSVAVTTSMADSAVAAVKAAIPDHLDHLPQLLHHASVFDAASVMYVTASAREGGAIKRAVLVDFAVDVRRNHVQVLDVVGRAFIPWVADPASMISFHERLDEEAARASLVMRRLIREQAPLGKGSMGGKAGIATAHNVCKTPTDALHADIIDVRLNTASRGARVNQAVDLIHMAVISAVRVQATYRFVRSVGGFDQDFSRESLGDLKHMRRGINAQIGNKAEFLRSAARDMDVERYEHFRTQQPVTAEELSKIVSEAVDPYWKPQDANFWTETGKLRDEANRGVKQASIWFSHPLLTAWRTHSSAAHGHVHEPEKLDKRRKCVLDCTGCDRAAEAHPREGPTTCYMCKRCGVALSMVKRDHFGGRSSWDVFHGDKVMPAHPYLSIAEGSAAPTLEPATQSSSAPSATSFTGAPLNASQPSNSARKRRNKRMFHEAAGSSAALNLVKAFQKSSD